MRRINTLVVCLLLLCLALHAIPGSFLLGGIGSSGGRLAGLAAAVLLVLHVLTSTGLTARTLRRFGYSRGAPYWRQNWRFWVRRISGLCILGLFTLHLGLFGSGSGKTFLLHEFTTARLIIQLLLIAAIYIHLSLNAQPLLVALGISRVRERSRSIIYVLSLLSLFMAGMVIFYYLRWQ